MELPLEWNIRICILQPGMFDTNVFAASQYPPHHPAYTCSVTADLQDTYKGLSPDGDPHKLAEVLYRLVVGVDEGKGLPLFLPIGEDALGKLQGKLRKMNSVLVDAAPWSVDLKKDDKAKL